LLAGILCHRLIAYCHESLPGCIYIRLPLPLLADKVFQFTKFGYAWRAMLLPDC
jgi:hypothetical protein